jgi:hypothetical protein
VWITAFEIGEWQTEMGQVKDGAENASGRPNRVLAPFTYAVILAPMRTRKGSGGWDFNKIK